MAKESTAPAAPGAQEITGNSELLQLASTLEIDAGMLPESKAEVAAADAEADAKKAAIEAGAAMVKKGLTMMAAAACSKYPALEPVWNESVIDRIARAAAAVLLKYGVESGPFMAKYAEEIELIMAAGEPLLVSYFIIKKAKENEINATGGLPNGDASNTITPAAMDTPNNPQALS